MKKNLPHSVKQKRSFFCSNLYFCKLQQRNALLVWENENVVCLKVNVYAIQTHLVGNGVQRQPLLIVCYASTLTTVVSFMEACI